MHELSKTGLNYHLYIYVGFDISHIVEQEDRMIKYSTKKRIPLYYEEIDSSLSRFADLVLVSPSSSNTDVIRVTESIYANAFRDLNNVYMNDINLREVTMIWLNLMDSKRFTIIYTGWYGRSTNNGYQGMSIYGNKIYLLYTVR